MKRQGKAKEPREGDVQLSHDGVYKLNVEIDLSILVFLLDVSGARGLEAACLVLA